MSATRSIPDFGQDEIVLSDIIVAANRSGVLIKGSHRIAPLPGHEVSEGETFRLYYEMYNTMADDGIRVSVIVAPTADNSLRAQLGSLISRRAAQSIQFSDVSKPDSDGVVRVSREIAGELEPGVYVIEVQVHNDRTGGTSISRTHLVVSSS
jgi:hypothetical protein